MTSVATGIGVCCAVSLNMAAVLVHQTPPPPTPKPPLQTSAKPTEAEITLTGCLVQGSAPNVFVLQNAKRDPKSATEKAARYVVVPAAEDLVLKPHLNHQVRILGVPDGRPQPTPQAGGTIDEKLVPALSAKSLTMVSAACGTDRVARSTALGEEAPPARLAMASGVVDVPLVNSEPVTLLLIASGLLLVGYAGRRNEWKAFGRRSAR
jgi:hypothetical protein